MLQLGILYLLPFISIFMIFGKLCNRYNQKSGSRIFIALILFFGFQFVSRFITFLLILKFSLEENPKQTIVDNIFLINLSSFLIGALVTFFYYRFTDRKMIISFLEKNDEINQLGEK